MTLLSACGGGGGGAGGVANIEPNEGGMISALRLPAEGQAATPGVYNFNPYAPNPMAQRWLYENLMYQNTLNCEIVPALATDFKWTDSATLEMTIREGVTWSDGTPFTPDDVVWTFEQAIKSSAMDRQGLTSDFWGKPLKSVKADGQVVTFSFEGPAAGKFQGVINTIIVPKHIFSNFKNVVEEIVRDPVTSGPFKFGSFNGRALVLDRREEYWNAENIKVNQLRLEGQFDANTAALRLQNGQLDAYWGDINNPERSFVQHDPDNNGFFYAPVGSTIVTPNNTTKPFDDLVVRKAVAMSLDKEDMALRGTYGIMDPASQSGLRMPYFKDLLPSGIENLGVITRDVDGAKKLLEEAGYKAAANGMRTYPNGKALTVTFQVQAGWVDYLAMANIVVRNLRDIGIDARVVATEANAVDAMIRNDNFQVLLQYLDGGCNFARSIGGGIDSRQISTATETLPNVSRFSDPAVDKVVDQLQAAQTVEETNTLVTQLSKVYYERFPVIPTVYAPDRIIYRMDRAVGWPSVDDPYAAGSNVWIILQHLRARE
ncbi:MAG: ABC transporter substrate-binding protein [Candidatus Nanopelagicales bacterium]